MSYELKVSVVASCHSKWRLISLYRFVIVLLRVFFFLFLSSLQYTPDMDFNKFVTLWIFSLCLVEKCWTDRTSSGSPEIQVVETGVSGKLLIILVLCENSLLLYFIYSPVEFSGDWLAGNVLLFVPHLCDSADTICSPAENSPAGSPCPQPPLRTTYI